MRVISMSRRLPSLRCEHLRGLHAAVSSSEDDDAGRIRHMSPFGDSTHRSEEAGLFNIRSPDPS